MAVPVQVLMDLGYLSAADYESWRFGRVDYLERICKVNLHKLAFIMKEVRIYARNHNLKPSYTFYKQWGRKGKKPVVKLRFSKSGNENIERSYATHYISEQWMDEHKKQTYEPIGEKGGKAVSDAKRITFDLSGDDSLASAKRLEGILSSGHWSDKGVNYEDERTMLLLRLLHIGGIAVYKRTYIQKTGASLDLNRRAMEMNWCMHKRQVSQTLIDIADIFSAYEYDAGKTTYNSLFFPALKTFVRCGGISPDKLFELLEQDGCDMVMLFPDAYGEDFFYTFSLAMPRAEFLRALAGLQDKIMAAMQKALDIAYLSISDAEHTTQ